jgi:hypothetical protein
MEHRPRKYTDSRQNEGMPHFIIDLLSLDLAVLEYTNFSQRRAECHVGLVKNK